MTLKRLLHGGAWLTVGNAFSSLAGFLRNIVVARLVSVEDFGIVVLLSLVLSVLETVSNLAIDRLLVQAKDGDDPKLQDTSHALQVVRGVIGCLLVLVFASTLASLFKVPEAAWAFQTLALVPLIRSFSHLDSVRVQRDLIFRPTFWVIVLPQVVALLIAIPLAYWLRNYSAIVWSMLAQALAYTLVTHLLALRPYRWIWDGAVVTRILSFGWPLLLNGLLMFVIYEGDKAVVAMAFTTETVGWYGAAFMLTMAPALLITSVVQGLFLPLLSRVQSLPSDFAYRYVLTVEACLGAGLLLGSLFVTLGPELLHAFFGQTYMAGAEVIVLLGVSQGVRVAKSGLFVCAIAQGNTRDPLMGNLGRGLGFISAILVVVAGYGPLAVAAAGLFGEVVSYLIATYLLVARGHPTNKWFFPQLVMFLSLVVASAIVGTVLRAEGDLLTSIIISLLWIVFEMLVYLAVARSVKQLLLKIRRVRHDI